MYKVQYNYSNTALDWFSSFLCQLYSNSCAEYSNIINNSDIKRSINYKMIEKFVNCVEDYVYILVILDYVDNDNFNDFVTQLRRLKAIYPCPFVDAKNNSINSKINQNRILVNPYIESSTSLLSTDVTRLCIYYELSRFIHSMYSRDIETYISAVYRENMFYDNEFDLREKAYIYKGFDLLDVSLSQNIAEDVLYYSLKVKRPNRSLKYNFNMFKTRGYNTNFQSRGELQDVTIIFGSTLNGVIISNNCNEDEIMYNLSKKSLNRNFVDSIIKQYTKDSNMNEQLLYLLMYFGGILDSSDKLLGLELYSDSSKLSDDYFAGIVNICNKNCKCKIK